MTRLFRLMLPKLGERTRRINSNQQHATFNPVSARELEIRFGPMKPDENQYIFGSGEVHFPEAPLEINATVRFRLDGDHLSGWISLENQSRETITGVIFPFVGGMNVAGEKPARFVLPSTSQRVFPYTVAVFTGQRANRYPAMLTSPWLNFESEAGSLAIEALSGLDAQDAYFSLNRGMFYGGSAYEGRYEYPVAGWISYPQLAAGNAWSSDEMRLHIHREDWHQVASENREWRRQQAKPARGAAFDEQLGFATYRLKGDDNTIRWSYGDIADLADDAAKAGFSRLVIKGWRMDESASNPAPFGEIADPRLGGDSDLRAVIDSLAKRNVDLIFAFHPALMNVHYDDYPPSHADWLVRSSLGASQIPVNFLANTLDYPMQLSSNRYRVEIDPSSDATDYLLREAERLKSDYGMRNLLLVGVGQRAFLSYVRRTGAGPAAAYRLGYDRLLGGLRERFHDGLLIAEGYNDLVNPYADAAYTWSQSHAPEVLPLSTPWQPLSYDVEALDYRTANLAFAHGALINLIVDGGTGTVGRYEGFAGHLKGLAALKRSVAPYYGQAEFRDQLGLATDPDSADAVVRVFRNETGEKTGIVAVNLGKEETALQITVAESLAGRVGTWHRAGGTGTATPDETYVVTLGPYECAVLAIDD